MGGLSDPSHQTIYSTSENNDSDLWEQTSTESGNVTITDDQFTVVADAEGDDIYSDDVSSSTMGAQSIEDVDLSSAETLYIDYDLEASRRDDGVGNNETGYAQIFLNDTSVHKYTVFEEDTHDSNIRTNKDTAQRSRVAEIDVSNNDSGTVTIESRAHSSNSGYTITEINDIWTE